MTWNVFNKRKVEAAQQPSDVSDHVSSPRAEDSVTALEARLDTLRTNLAVADKVANKIVRILEYRVREHEYGTLDYAPAQIRIRLGGGGEQRRLTPCGKEPWTVEWIEKFVKPGQVLYDVGANVGVYSLIAAKATEGKARVVAFEPGYENFAALCHNIVANNCSESISPLPIGLDAQTRLNVFSYSDLQAGAAMHTFGKSASRYEVSEATVYTQPVLAFALDDLIPQFGLPVPNHLKLDVDGTETEVLQGARRTLESPSLQSVMVEIREEESDQIVGFLADRGLPLSQKYVRPDKHGNTPPWYYGLFMRA